MSGCSSCVQYRLCELVVTYRSYDLLTWVRDDPIQCAVRLPYVRSQHTAREEVATAISNLPAITRAMCVSESRPLASKYIVVYCS